MPDPRHDSAKSHETLGFVAGLACFATWGLIPGYWKLIAAVPATEILAHRFVWTTLFLSLVLSWQRRWHEVVADIRSPRARFYCLTGGVAIATNWFLFIFAVNTNRVIETSLGYFMTPLMNVLFGALFLRERLTRVQLVSVLLALCGVLNLTFGYGRFPWIAICICFSFGLYGLLRKKSGTAVIPGLFIETILLLPIAIGFLIYLERANTLAFGHAGLRLVNPACQHRCRYSSPSILVRLCRAPSSADHVGLSPISVANSLVPSRRVSLSRTIHPRAARHFRINLDRPRRFHGRGDRALAFKQGSRNCQLRVRSLSVGLNTDRARTYANGVMRLAKKRFHWGNRMATEVSRRYQTKIVMLGGTRSP